MSLCVPKMTVGSLKKVLPSAGFLTLLSFFALPLSHSEATSFTTGLVGHWNLDETSGTDVLDSSGNSNNGTRNGATISTDYAPTIFDNTRALSFDGNDYVEDSFASQPQGNVSVTVSAWVKFSNSASAIEVINFFGTDSISNKSGYFLYRNASGKAVSEFGSGEGSAAGTTTLAASKWYHLAAVYDGSTNKIFVDGTLETTSNFSSANFSGNKHNIGTYSTSGDSHSLYLTGKIDDVRIYDRALSAEEISVLAAEKSLVGYWKFDETIGTSAADSSGMGNTGTLTNSPTISTDVPTTNFSNTRSLNFDGTDDYISIPNSTALNPTLGITVSSWVRIDGGSGMYRTIVSKPASTSWANPYAMYNVRFNLNNRLEAFINNGQAGSNYVTSNTTFAADSSWHHIAFTYDGATQILYIDGVEDASNALVDTIDTSTEPLIIGNSIPGNPEVFNGGIDDVRIYNRTLSADEIADLAAGNHPEATWTGEHSIYYEDPHNWDTGVVPDPYSNVTIANAGARPILTDAASLSDLTVNAGASLDLKDKDLTMLDGGTFSNNGTLILDGSQTLTDFTNDSNSGQAIITGQSNSTSFATGNTYYDLRIEDPTENGLVGYWKLDEGSGSTTLDLSGNDSDGTLTNGATWSTSTGSTTFFNTRSVSFDGVNDYITAPMTSLNTGTSPRSIAGWLYMNNTASVKVPFAYGSCGSGNDGKAFGVYLDASEALHFWGCGTADISTGTSVSTASWHHIAVTYDGTYVQVYADGVAAGSATARTLGVGSTEVAIGSDGSIDTNNYPFSGNVDDVRIYDRALSADEVASLAAGNYANGTTSTATHTPTTIPTINGDLALDSGNLNLGSNSLTVTDRLEVNGGTLTHGVGTIAVASYVQQGGVFSGGAGSIGSGPVTLSGGTFISTSGTMTIGGTSTALMTVSDAVFSANSGAVVFNPTLNGCGGSYSVDVNSNITFNDLTFIGDDNCGDNRIRYISGDNDTIIVDGTLTHTDQVIQMAINLNGDLVVGANANQSDTLNLYGIGGSITFSGAGDQSYSVESGGYTTSFVIDKATGTVSPAPGTNSLSIETFTLARGEFTAPSGDMSLGGTTNSTTIFSQSGATVFNPNGGTLVLNMYNTTCGASLTIDANQTLNLENIEVSGSDNCGGNLITYSSANDDVIVASGSILLSNQKVNGSWISRGNMTAASTFDGGSASLTLSGSTTQVIESEGGTWPSGAFAINKASGTASLSGALTLNSSGQDLTLSGGTLDLAGHNLTVNDAFIVDDGATLRLQGDETVTTPALNAGSIVRYDGDSTPVTVKDWDYKTLDLSAPGKEFQFTAGGSYVVETEWIAEGTAGNVVTLRSTTDGVQWDIDPQGTRTLAYLDVQDSNNVNATAITTSGLNIDSSGNNTNWIFDVTAPTVSSFAPADGATNQARDVTLEIEFSEDVTAVAAKNITLKNLLNDNTIETITASGALVTVSGSTVTINPSVTIPYSTPVYVLMDSGAFKDEFGNDFAGIASNTTWNITIIDETYTPSSESSSESTGGGGGGGGGRGIAGPGGRSTKAEAERQALVDRFRSQVASDEVTVPPEGSASSRSTKPTIVKGSASSSPTQTAQTSSARVVTQDRGHLKVQDGVVAVLYKDVPVDAWFAPYVSLLIEENIADGYKDESGKPKGEFGVTNPVTYAEVAKMVLEAADKDLKKAGTPRNLSAKGTWASPYIALAESLQMSVYTPPLDVMKPATRGDVIQSILEAFDIPVKAKNIASFSDLPENHPHAQAIGVAYLYGLIDGDTNPDGTPKGTVRPDDQVNRAEVAKIIALALKLL